MADVNLREYVAKLDDWMQEGSADHVVWHARHILQYYPKNVDAYRYVGQALASLGHLEEASAVLRRVLSVIPDDGKAHAVLSEIYERLNRPNEAIWHMERAYEQDTNNPEVIDELQRLYREHRHITNPRLHLTTAAAARQDIRSGAYDRAVNALRSALDRAPQRADLQLLLAQALWRRGDLVDAAEVAMDVLQTYPDCMSANQIMAELWLQEGRPSDAQRYVNRLESIDPYLALELVQPSKSDPNTFWLPELDFDRTTQKEMVGDKLDWLEGIDASDAPAEILIDNYQVDVDSWLQEPEVEAMTAEAEDTSRDQEEDWLSQLDSIEQNYNVSANEFQMTTSPLSDESAQAETEIEEAPVTAEAEEEVDLSIEWASDSTAEPEVVAEDDPFKWLLTPEDELSDDVPATLDTADPLAWMRQADIDLPDTTELSPEMLQEASEEDDAMGWLRDYNTDMIGDWEDTGTSANQEAAPEDVEPLAEELSFPDIDELILDELPFPSDEDESAESIAIDAFLDEPDLAEVTSLPDDAPQAEVMIESPVDEWAESEALLEESLGIEALTDTPAASTEPGDEFLIEAQDQTEPPIDEFSEVEASAYAVQDPEQGNIMSDTTPPDFEWLDDESETSGEPPSTGATGMLDWLSRSEPVSSSDEEEMAEAVGAEAFQPEDGSTGMTDTLNWMEGDDAVQDEAPDIEKADDESTGSTGMLNWLSQNRPLPPTMPLQPHDIAEQAQEFPMNDAEEWLASLEDEEINILDEESTGATGMLDWLGKEGSPSETSREPVSTGELENADEWLADIMAEEEAIPQEVAASIEWEPQIEMTEAESDLEDLGWLNAEALPNEEVSADDLTMIEGIEAETAAALQAAGITSFQALAQVDETNLNMALQAQGLSVAFDLSRWVAQARFLAEGDIQGFYNFQDSVIEDNQSQMPDAEPADLDWLSQEEPAEDEEEQAEEPEWLATSMSVEDDEEEEPVAEPADLDWLSQEEEQPEDEEQPQAEPEWLASTAMLVENAGEELAAESEANLDWPSQEEEPAEDEEQPQAEPEWLASTAMFVENAEEEASVPEIESHLAWFGEDEEADAVEDAQEEPEWLEASMSVEDDEEEPVAEPADLDWLGEDAEADAVEVLPEGLSWLDSDALADDEEERVETAEESSEEPAWVTATEALQGTVDAGEAESWLAEELAAASEEGEWGAEELESVEAMLLDEGEEEAVPDWMSEEPEPEMLGDTEFDPLAAIDAAEEVLAPTATSGMEYELQEAGEAGFEAEEADAWNLDAEPYEEETSVEPVEAEMESDEYFTAFEDVPEAAEIAPAPNAPDWLNAMVPGLDIDYEAPEDEPVETEFETTVEDELEPTMPEDFGWVNEIVEEETQPEPALEGIQERAPRFVFSRPPVWLRRLLERRPQKSSEDDDDLPAWLR